MDIEVSYIIFSNPPYPSSNNASHSMMDPPTYEEAYKQQSAFNPDFKSA